MAYTITDDEEKAGLALAGSLMSLVSRSPGMVTVIGLSETVVKFCLSQPDPRAALAEVHKLQRDVLEDFFTGKTQPVPVSPAAPVCVECRGTGIIEDNLDGPNLPAFYDCPCPAGVSRIAQRKASP